MRPNSLSFIQFVKVSAYGVFGIACMCGVHIQKMMYVSEKSNTLMSQLVGAPIFEYILKLISNWKSICVQLLDRCTFVQQQGV